MGTECNSALALSRGICISERSDRTVGEFYPTEIISKIAEFNKNTANVEIVWEHLMFTKGNLWLTIKVDGVESNPINYEKINE